MKTWIRIVVAFSVVVILGFAVWAFFFDEDDEVMAYNDMTQMIEYRESMALRERLVVLKSLDYYGEDKANVFSSEIETGKQICELRDIILSDNVVTINEATFNSLFVYDEMTGEIFKELLPYLNGNKIHRKSQRALTKSINTYLDNLREVSTDLDNLIYSQKITTIDDSVMIQLVNKYKSFKSKYIDLLGYAGDVVSNSIEYINLAVYDGKYKSDTNFALYDCYGRALYALANTPIPQEEIYNQIVYTIADKITKVNSNEIIFTSEYTELKFLESYNTILYKYSDSLDEVFSQEYQYGSLVKMADNDAGTLSKFVDDFKAPIVVVLNVLGF